MNIESWLEELSDISSSCPERKISTSPTSPAPPADRNKRRLSRPRSRQPSPSKRRRTDDDGTGQEIISLSSEISLSDRTKLRSNASTSSRQGSPTRDIFNQLRLVNPPIICEPQATGSIPDSVLSLRRRLTDGFGQNVIPGRLEPRIRASDPVGAEEIPETAFFDSGDMPEAALDSVWDELEEIRLEARNCDMYGQDENAWCLDVVQPVLNRPLEGSRKLQLTSVQSQLIDAELLPIMKGSLMRISKKADYAYSFSCRDAEVSTLYQHISFGGNGYQIGHTADAFNKRTILFSGIGVKPNDGGKKEALAQLSIWLNANLEKMRALQVLAESGRSVPMNLLPTVGFTVIGHDWYMYIAYRLEDEMHIVGPISTVLADTRSIYGILKLQDLTRRVKQYALDIYWPWVRNEILQPLAKSAWKLPMVPQEATDGVV